MAKCSKIIDEIRTLEQGLFREYSELVIEHPPDEGPRLAPHYQPSQATVLF